MQRNHLPAAADSTPLNRENLTALYEQIAACLREEIVNGRYEPSGRLPSEAEIGRRFAVSRVTVRLAVDRLVDEGLVIRRQGKGSYTSGKQMRHGLDTLRSFHESLRSQGLDAQMVLLAKTRMAMPVSIGKLFLADAADCLFLQRLHLVDGEPVAVGNSYLPAQLDALSWEEMERTPTYSLLAATLGVAVVRADIAIRAQPADEVLARLLQIAPAAALLVMVRNSYLADGRCCDQSTFYIRPERYAFTVSSLFKAEG